MDCPDEFEAQKVDRWFKKYLGEYNGNYVFLEQTRIKQSDIKMILSVRVVKKSTLKTVLLKNYTDIGVQVPALIDFEGEREEKYFFVEASLGKNVINVFAQDRMTKALKVLNINLSTLALQPPQNTLFDTSQKFNGDSEQSEISSVSVTVSSSGSYCLVRAVAKNGEEGITSRHLLYNGNFELMYNKVVDFDKKIGTHCSWNDNYVDENGACWVEVDGYENEEFLKRGSSYKRVLLLFSTSGEIENMKTIILAEDFQGSFSFSTRPFRLPNAKKVFKEDKYYLFGYDENKTGFVSVIVDLKNDQKTYQLNHNPFSPEINANFKSYKEKLYKKAYADVTLKGKNFVPLVLSMGSVTIINKEIYVIGYAKGESKMFSTLEFNDLMITKFSSDGEFVYSKLLKKDESASSYYSVPMHYQKAYEFSESVVILTNAHYNMSNGIGLTGEEFAVGKVALSIPSDGKSWKKIPIIYHGDNASWNKIYLDQGIRESQHHFVFPARNSYKRDFRYVRITVK